MAHTIPAAFYRNLNNDLIIEYVPTKTGSFSRTENEFDREFSLADTHEVFIRTQNNLLEICPIRILSFGASHTYEPVLRIQVKEILQHTFEGVFDRADQLHIEITGETTKRVERHSISFPRSVRSAVAFSTKFQ